MSQIDDRPKSMPPGFVSWYKPEIGTKRKLKYLITIVLYHPHLVHFCILNKEVEVTTNNLNIFGDICMQILSNWGTDCM